jgi:hypothetical protein
MVRRFGCQYRSCRWSVLLFHYIQSLNSGWSALPVKRVIDQFSFYSLVSWISLPTPFINAQRLFERSVYQYIETNVMHFLFSWLRIKGLHVFRALLTYPQEALYKWHLVYCVRVMSVGWSRIGAANWHNTYAIYQLPFVKRLLRVRK